VKRSWCSDFSYWFGTTGSTLLSDLARLENARLPAIAGLLGALVGLATKQRWLHFISGRRMPTMAHRLSVAAYLSVVPKVGAVFGLAQIARNLPDGQPDWRLILALLAALSMTLRQPHRPGAVAHRSITAYSSIAQRATYFWE